MTRLQQLDPETASGRSKELLDTIQSKMGRVPNIFKYMSNSPAALEGYLNFSGALAGGLLDAQLRERIAIVVAETNHCQYCLSAHFALGKMAGLSDAELKNAREIHSTDPKAAAALSFVRNLLLRRHELPEGEIVALKEAGFSDGEIAEIIANVALNWFTNYFNLIVQPEIDFPKVELAFPV